MLSILRRTLFPTTIVLLCSGILWEPTAFSQIANIDWPVLYEEKWDQSPLMHWAATDPNAWRREEHDGGYVIHQFQQSRVQTPVRSPFNRLMLRSVNVSDFQLDVDVQSTARDYPHRSLCLFFGYQDPAHFYYIHLGQRTDDHANQIFIVNNAPRVKISSRTTEGTPWDNEWHHVRITRDVESGSIEVYFDDMQTPVMIATDKTFTWGEVGLGSFDDTGRFDNIVLRGVRADSTHLPEHVGAEHLDGTEPLTLDEPLDVVMVRGINGFAEAEIARARKQRAQYWQHDYTSAEAYRASVSANRERFRTIVGAVDERVPVRMLIEPDASLAESSNAPAALNVTWSVLDGVSAEGLLIRPKKTPVAAVVLIPDASWQPYQLVESDKGEDSPFPLGNWLAANRCLVVIPTLINRDFKFSSHPDIRQTNIPHREHIYRMAFEMGRHIIGYEAQKVMAAADYFEANHSELPLAVCGAGDGGLLALYTAALDERFDACLVSGYVQEREGVWREPIDRNVWRLLRDFGDADIASLIAPRPLIIEACRVPEMEIPAQPLQEPFKMAAPGKITSAPLDSVRAEFERAREHYQKLGVAERLQLIVTDGSTAGDGQGAPFSEDARMQFLRSLGVDGPDASFLEIETVGGHNDADEVQRRQIGELVAFTQRLLHSSDKVRDKFWKDADRSSVDKWVETAGRYRDYVHEEMIGKLPPSTSPLNPRSRKVLDEPTHVGYEVMLDVYPPTEPPTSSHDLQLSTLNTEHSTFNGVIAGGILLLPKDLKEHERRPVVVFQHGLEGTPMDTITTDESTRAWQSYKGVSTQLVKQGFIVYAPQNPYRGGDQFRAIQRKSNPLGRSLFSYIIEQHRQTLRWLATLPWVDPERIAFYGLSYGGKTAARVPPLLGPVSSVQSPANAPQGAALGTQHSTMDSPTYCLSICSADFNEWIRKNVSHEDRYSYIYTQEYEMFEWNMGHVAGYAELATLMTPRPFMVERGHTDGVAPDEWVAWEFAKVRRHYDQLGLGERARIEFFNGPHTINGQGTLAFLHEYLDWPAGE